MYGELYTHFNSLKKWSVDIAFKWSSRDLLDIMECGSEIKEKDVINGSLHIVV